MFAKRICVLNNHVVTYIFGKPSILNSLLNLLLNGHKPKDKIITAKKAIQQLSG